MCAWNADGRDLPATSPSFVQQAYLKASNTGEGDFFGSSVALSGDTLVIGAPEESSDPSVGEGDGNNDDAPGSGAVYVFVRSGGSWVQEAFLKASNAGENDSFGTSVDISGDTIVVGASGEASATTEVNGEEEDDSLPGSGAAYIFTRADGVWTQQAYLKASNAGWGAGFGFQVSVSEDTAVVAARNADGEYPGPQEPFTVGRFESGVAYVFHRSGDEWSQQALLEGSDSEDDDEFGCSVDVFGDTVVVGANGGIAAMEQSGAAYIFEREGDSWEEEAYLPAPDEGAVSFGESVAISGDTIVIGAPGEVAQLEVVDGELVSAFPVGGNAYVYGRSEDGWSEQARLRASNAEVRDRFGSAVAISGDTIVVGAIREDSGASGVDGAEHSNSAEFAGAAYVFRRTGDSWTQRAYLKASNTGAEDRFGNAVAVSGDTIAIGAYLEDSHATGVDGTQGDDSMTSAGAAYVFVPAPPAPPFSRPDNLVGKRANRHRQKGDDIRNRSAAGQRIRIRKNRRAAKVHFTTQNDGTGGERFRFRARPGNRRVSVKYFSSRGGKRRNVTGRLTSGRYRAYLNADASVRFMARARMTPEAGRRERRVLFLRARASNGRVDKVVAKVILKQ